MGLKNVLIAHNKILTNLNLTAMGFGVDCSFKEGWEVSLVLTLLD